MRRHPSATPPAPRSHHVSMSLLFFALSARPLPFFPFSCNHTAATPATRSSRSHPLSFLPSPRAGSSCDSLGIPFRCGEPVVRSFFSSFTFTSFWASGTNWPFRSFILPHNQGHTFLTPTTLSNALLVRQPLHSLRLHSNDTCLLSFSFARRATRSNKNQNTENTLLHIDIEEADLADLRAPVPQKQPRCLTDTSIDICLAHLTSGRALTTSSTA
jgi:hypothetical protein